MGLKNTSNGAMGTSKPIGRLASYSSGVVLVAGPCVLRYIIVARREGPGPWRIHYGVREDSLASRFQIGHYQERPNEHGPRCR
jgi:hypothetical protein